MVEKISVAIALEGGREVEQQLADIGQAGQKAFADISKSAEQAGGFKNLKPEDVSAKLEEMGVTGTDAIKKIQDAVKSASRFETVVQGVAAVENGFLALARAAGVVGGVLAVVGLAASRYISQAAKVSEELTPLADISGRAMQSISALQIAFAQGGTSAQQFAKEFTDLQVKVAEASRTTANDVAQSSQRIAQANLNAAQSAKAVVDAQRNVQRAVLQTSAAQTSLVEKQIAARQALSGVIDPNAQKLIADALEKQLGLHEKLVGTDAERIVKANKLLDLRKAEQQLDDARRAEQSTQEQVEAALLRQQEAQHAQLMANANDLSRVIGLYEQMGQGAKVAFDPLTTAATKTQALYAALARATQGGQTLEAALADIVRNASALERLEIGKALGLDPKTVQTLAQGSEALRATEQAAQDLGLTLNNVDQQNLKAFSDSWNTLSADGSASMQKLAASFAPVATGLMELATVSIQAFSGMSDPIANTQRELETLYGVLQKIIAGMQQIGQRPPSLGEAGGVQIGGAAAGGLIGGRGTGTSDSNLAWVSRGEHIMPARAVQQPGVLTFLEALRRTGGSLSRVLDGMGRFALGGLVPRPALAYAGGGLVGGMSNVTIAFPGLQPITGLRASSAVVDELRHAAALAQVRSGGRKPSRYS